MFDIGGSHRKVKCSGSTYNTYFMMVIGDVGIGKYDVYVQISLEDGQALKCSCLNI